KEWLYLYLLFHSHHLCFSWRLILLHWHRSLYLANVINNGSLYQWLCPVHVDVFSNSVHHWLPLLHDGIELLSLDLRYASLVSLDSQRCYPTNLGTGVYRKVCAGADGFPKPVLAA